MASVHTGLADDAIHEPRCGFPLVALAMLTRAVVLQACAAGLVDDVFMSHGAGFPLVA